MSGRNELAESWRARLVFMLQEVDERMRDRCGNSAGESAGGVVPKLVSHAQKAQPGKPSRHRENTGNRTTKK